MGKNGVYSYICKNLMYVIKDAVLDTSLDMCPTVHSENNSSCIASAEKLHLISTLITHDQAQTQSQAEQDQLDSLSEELGHLDRVDYLRGTHQNILCFKASIWRCHGKLI